MNRKRSRRPGLTRLLLVTPMILLLPMTAGSVADASPAPESPAQLEEPLVDLPPDAQVVGPDEGGGGVVVSAGHGRTRYFPPGGQSFWNFQRDLHNGVQEDLITTEYATELSNWLLTRGVATPFFPRSVSSAIHEPSGLPWRKVSARYYLQLLYPENPEIWHSLPRADGNDRHEKEDIRSRPLYANHIGADAIISLHTNAGPPSATGTRVYYYPGRADDRDLGNNVLCAMKEIIQANDAYEDFRVDDEARTKDHGENRLAVGRRAIVVETAFHTNADDARALRDPAFRAAAMKGVAKGYRIDTAGQTCEPFEIDEIPNVTGREGLIPVKVFFVGFPEFKVKAEIEITDCPAGFECYGGTVEYAETESPLSYNFNCELGDHQSATFGLRTRLTDVDNVETEWVEHSLTCLASADGGDPAHSGPPTFSLVQ